MIENISLGMSRAWPLFAIGLGSIGFALLVTLVMILKFVTFRKPRERMSIV